MKKIFLCFVIVILMAGYMAPGINAACDPRNVMVPAQLLYGKITCPDDSDPTSVTLNSATFDGTPCDLSNIDFFFPSTKYPDSNFELYFWANYLSSHDIVLNFTATCAGCGGPVTRNFSFNFPAGAFYYNQNFKFTSCPPTPTPTFTLKMTNTPGPTSTPTPPGLPTITPTPSPTINSLTFDLCPGLNLISVPFQDPGITNASELLADFCSNDADALWIYYCISQIYLSWTILDPGPGWDLYTGMPVWVNITNPGGCRWTAEGTLDTSIFYQLCTGLTLVSLPVYSNSIDSAADMLADIPNCQGVFKYTRMISCIAPPGFVGYFPFSAPDENFYVKKGYSYWVTASDRGIWIPPNP